MTIQVSCPCGRSLHLSDDLHGKKIVCPGCGAVVVVSQQGVTGATASPLSGSRSVSLPVLIAGVVAVLLLISVGVWGALFFSRDRSASPAVVDLAEITVSPDVLPVRPTLHPEFASGVRFGRTRLTGSGPAEQTQINVYMPPGDHAEKSLGCVLVAPAGTNLLIGNSLEGENYHNETLPYAEAGFLVIHYSLDGAVRDMETATNSEFGAGYKSFRAANAGLLNTRHAIEFVKARFPEVDPARIYTAGHSSAGTVSLLAAEFYSDIAACVAYAPCSDPEAFHQELSSVWGISAILPGMQEFDRQFSPKRNVDQLSCPLFIFQARDDSIVDFNETRLFVELARQTNPRIQYVEVGYGDHHDSMINEGMPSAIDWLRQLDAERRKH